MKRDKKEGFLEFAKILAKGSGKIILDDFKKERKFRRKEDGSLVTETDLKSEKFIIERIRKKYPDHGILAEESGNSKSESEYMWIIDPLDGTHNFIYGLPLFGVSIALARKEEVIAGVIYLPVPGELYYAERGKGAFLNGKRIHVSMRNEKEALVLNDSCFAGKKEKNIASLGKLADIFGHIRMFGSAVINFTPIASGTADVYVERTIKPWDLAAGCLLVEEAGGKVTEISGKPWNIWSKDFIASNGKFHDRMTEILKE